MINQEIEKYIQGSKEIASKIEDVLDGSSFYLDQLLWAMGYIIINAAGDRILEDNDSASFVQDICKEMEQVLLSWLSARKQDALN